MGRSNFGQMANQAAVRFALFGTLCLLSFAAGALDGKIIEPNVLRIVAFRGADQFVIGTGVTISPNGLLLTTAQLLNNADRLLVLDGGLDIDQFGRPAVIRASSPDLDLAVIESAGLQRSGLPISAASPAVGAKVATVMFPGNVGPAAALPTPGMDAGTVAALLSAPLRGARPAALIQHNATPKDATYPGPLVDDCNRIVGFTVVGGPGAPGTGGRFAVAGSELIRLLEAEGLIFSKATTSCPPAPVTTAAVQQAPKVSAALVREAQNLLNGLGFNVGVSDGVAGPRTTNAVMAFQKTKAVVPNGEIDDALLKLLRDSAVAQAQPSPPIPAAQPVQPVAATQVTAQQPPAPPPVTAAAAVSVWPYALAGAVVALTAAAALILVFWFKRRAPANASLERASAVLRAARAARDGVDAPNVGDRQSWILHGSTANGQPVRLLVDAATTTDAAGGIVIGRSPKLAGLVLEDPSVSRSHARLTFSPDGLAIEDLQSTNGTQVDGVAMPAHRPTPLSEGAIISIGDVNMRLARA